MVYIIKFNIPKNICSRKSGSFFLAVLYVHSKYYEEATLQSVICFGNRTLELEVMLAINQILFLDQTEKLKPG